MRKNVVMKVTYCSVDSVLLALAIVTIIYKIKYIK